MEGQGTQVHELRVRGATLDSVVAERMLHDARAAFASGARALVIDLESVEAFDSWGISALIALQKEARGVRVVLASMSPAAQRIARATHLHHVFDIYADARTAVEDLSI